MIESILSISPLDGRYRSKTEPLADYFSEFGLNKYRIKVEIEWLIYLADNFKLPQIKKLNDLDRQFLREISNYFDIVSAKKVKEIEHITNHDVKAVEYYLKEIIATSKLKDLTEFIHLGLTSEDINNTAYTLMVKDGFQKVIAPEIETLLAILKNLVISEKSTAILSLTHGQPATPSTLGKEILNFVVRIEKIFSKLQNFKFSAKFNGAVGNHNALSVTQLSANLIKDTNKFLESLDLEPNPFTTQIDPHDNLVEFLNLLNGLNSVLIDFSRDIWFYISRNIFTQKTNKQEVGSSTMPHKVNPIDFENAEGNLGLSQALASHLVQKLPISRLQRDLSDSTVLRNVGSLFAYHLISLKSLHKGLAKLKVNYAVLSQELNNNPELLAEAIQTIMRISGIDNPYEKLKELTRGKKTTLKDIHKFIKKLDLPETHKTTLLKLTPATYIGEAENLIDYYLTNNQ